MVVVIVSTPGTIEVAGTFNGPGPMPVNEDVFVDA